MEVAVMQGVIRLQKWLFWSGRQAPLALIGKARNKENVDVRESSCIVSGQVTHSGRCMTGNPVWTTRGQQTLKKASAQWEKRHRTARIPLEIPS